MPDTPTECTSHINLCKITPNHPLFFLHIPKTAGSSLISFIEDNISLSDYFAFVRVREIFSATRYINAAVLENANYVGGHMPPSVANHMRQPVNKITILREPAALVMSTFEHYKRDGFIPADVYIDDFINSQEGLILSNIQTRWISEFDIPGFDLKSSSPSKINSIINDDIYKLAVENLKEYAHVGISEKFKNTIVFLREYFNFNVDGNLVTSNTGIYNKNISPNTLKLINSINYYDIKLYEVALRFNAENKFSGIKNFDKITNSENLSDRRVFIDMDDALNIKGFHRRELWPDWAGVRWSSSLAEINTDVYIIPNVEYVFKIFAVSVINEENIHQLEVFIDDINLNISSKKVYASYNLSASFSSAKLLFHPKIRIKVPFALKPNDHTLFNSTDNRELGIAVKWIYLGPTDEYIEKNP